MVKLIKYIKYHCATEAVNEIRNLIDGRIIDDINKLKEIYENPVLTIVPSHKDRINKRGFCHLQIIIRQLNRLFKFPTNNEILIRVKNTKPQAQIICNKERYINLKGAFKFNKDYKNQYFNKNLFLFDDVSTSGFTIKQAAKELKSNGISKVIGLTLAR